MAEMFDKLMVALGYKKYVAQGGDWGAFITRRLAQLFPQRCVAIHVNFVFAQTPKFSQGPLTWLKWVTRIGPAFFYDKRDMEQLKKVKNFFDFEIGYLVWSCTSRN